MIRNPTSIAYSIPSTRWHFSTTVSVTEARVTVHSRNWARIAT
jgi:hypothetical protein